MRDRCGCYCCGMSSGWGDGADAGAVDGRGGEILRRRSRLTGGLYRQTGYRAGTSASAARRRKESRKAPPVRSRPVLDERVSAPSLQIRPVI